MTYPWPGTNFPVEIMYKIFVSTFGFFGQLAYGGGKFYDEEGDFKSMTELMYMTIYGMFMLHSVLDLSLWLRAPLVKGSNYASAATGFFWYAFALHSRTDDLEGVQMMVRTFPVFILLITSACFVLEPLWSRGFMCCVVRAFCVQTYATWCFQSAHVLHGASAFPGSEPNPSWDPKDHRNIAYTAAFFGLHLCINLVLVTATYTATALFLRMRHGIKVDNEDDITSGYGYKTLSYSDDVKESEHESKVKLLSSYAST
ncbi:uncharacterized protein [Littorina saxatilis]